MTSSPVPAVPAPADAVIDAAATDAGHGFIERALQMVVFLAQRDPWGAPAQQPEQELADWIAHWRGMPRRGLDATQHFVAEELGIIARALNGPADGMRLRPPRTDQMCWLIARCMSRSA